MSGWETIGETGGWEDVPEKPKSIFKQAKDAALKSGMLPEGLAASVEGALALGTGAFGQVAGGLAGAGRTLMSGPEEGAKTVARVSDALTYQPDSPLVGKALKPVGEFVDKWWTEPNKRAGEIITDVTGSPYLGARYVGGMEAAPNLLGLGPEATAARNAARVSALQKAPAAVRAAVAAREAKFTLPPSQVRPFSLTDPTSWLNNTLEGLSGKGSTAQVGSAKNQQRMQSGIRQQHGFGPDERLIPETYGEAIAREQPAYDALREAGKGAPYSEVPEPKYTQPWETGKAAPTNLNKPTIQPEVVTPGMEYSPKYLKEVGDRRNAVAAQIEKAPTTFKSMKSSLDLLDEAIKGNEIDPGHAVDRIVRLREDAKLDLQSGKSEVVARGNTAWKLAQDLETLFEHNLTKKGDFKTLGEFQAARKKMAQLFESDVATLPSEEINAKAFLAAQKRLQQGGASLEGAQADIANLETHFPKYTQLPSKVGGTPAWSPLDYMTLALGAGGVGGAAAGGSGLFGVAALAPLLRPGARKLITSDWYQNKFVNPKGFGPPSSVAAAMRTPGAPLAFEGMSERRQELLRQLLEEGAPQ